MGIDHNYLSFDSGIAHNKVFAHRGDIFITEGVFKELDKIDRDDHIVAKPTRPVLVISEDEYNQDVVKVLTFSSKRGSNEQAAINSYRSIKVPSVLGDGSSSFIDVSQVFTINVYQLKVKIGEASKAIVDAAVALHTIQNVNEDSMNTMMKVLKDRFPNAQPFQKTVSVSETVKETSVKFTVNNIFSPSGTLFSDVVRVPLEELTNAKKEEIKEPIDRDEALRLYNDYLKLGIDQFRQKYGLTNQQYYALRDRCVAQLLGKVTNFRKFDWA